MSPDLYCSESEGAEKLCILHPSLDISKALTICVCRRYGMGRLYFSLSLSLALSFPFIYYVPLFWEMYRPEK